MELANLAGPLAAAIENFGRPNNGAPNGTAPPPASAA
jgi:hypothetical protein